MILQMFSVYDSKSETFTQPTFAKTKGEMLRSFSEAVNEESHQFHKHSADFTLFHVGEYDDSSALCSSLPTPISLGLAQEFISVPF